MSKKLSLACLATLLLFAVCGFTLRKAVAQSEARIGIRNHVYKAPLEVVGIKVNGQSIEAGEQFTASQDWIKQLVVVVKNTSNRDLIGVGANVEFPYSEQDQPLLPEIEFKAGFDPMLNLGATDFLLRPGETKELHLPDGWHKAVDQVIKMADDLKRPSLTYNVIAKPELGAFSSTEVWANGSYRRYQDGKWVADKSAMKQVSLEVRQYWLNAPPRMLKASAAFSVVPKQPQDQDGPKDLTISRDYMSVPPLTILNARRTDEGLTVEVQNNGLAPIEYFELHLSDRRVWAGRNSISERHRDDPRNLEQPVLSLAPQEVRTFQFPVKTYGDGIKIEFVFLSNGQGWFQGFWLRKLDKANERGILWDVDHEESKRRMIR